MNNLIFGTLYVLGALAGLCMALVIGDVLYNALYRFCPAFRRKMDEYYDSLPMSKWEG